MASNEGQLQLFFAREKDHIKVFSLDPASPQLNLEKQEPGLALPTPKAAVWSPNGQLLALADQTNGVQVVEFKKASDSKGAEGVHTLPGSSKTTQTLQWSPDSKVLVSTSPATKGNTDPNIVAFSVDVSGETSTCSESCSFHYGKIEKDKKIMQWTHDSRLCARLTQEGNLVIVPGDDVGGEVLAELAMAHPVQNFEFAPTQLQANKYRIAIFVPDVRDDMQRVQGPAEVTIWELTSQGEGDDMIVLQNRKAVSSVSSGQISDLQWNHNSTALLAHCQTEVDETGASYYGGSKLLLLSSDGSYQCELTEIEDGAPNGTTVQAVSWSPSRDEFVLIRGFQPAQSTLWSWDVAEQKATMTKVLLEKAHRNTIRFNRFGSLVCLAGFGNLAGDVDFFGRRDSEKCDYVRVSGCQANCTVAAEWSQDGRHFLTAVLAPRMRVDNGVCIWKALAGSKVSSASFEELFDVDWRPDTVEGHARFSDITQEEFEKAVKEVVDSPRVAKKQAYRPPKARGEVSGNVAAMMRGEMAPEPQDDRRRNRTRPDGTRIPQRRDEAEQQGENEEDSKTSPTTSSRKLLDAPAPCPPKAGGAGEDHSAGGYPKAAAAPQAKPTPWQQSKAPPQKVSEKAAAPAQTAAVARGKAPPAAQLPWHPKVAGVREMPSGREGQISHGEKLPCPSNGWQYIDPKQNIQGPFSLLEMQQWHSMGYFRTNLMMRCDPNDRFVTFGELYPHPMVPFQSYPKRPH